MKKTIIALMALSGTVFASDGYQKLWTLDFTTLQRTGNSVEVELGEYKFKVWDGTLSNAGITSNYTPATTTTNEAGETVNVPAKIDRVHITGDTGVTWGDNFAVEVVFTLPNSFDKGSNWPAIFNMYGDDNDDNLRFGPYTGITSYGMDGVSSSALVKPSDTDKDWTNVTLTTDVQHTALITVTDGAVVLTIDGAVAAKATLNTSKDYYDPSITIDNMLIGGHQSNSVSSGWNMDATVSSITMYKMVPEPTTATLSLLALAGLAARRRRK